MVRMDIENLVEQLRAGELSRRGFMRRATALGVSATTAGMLARTAAAQTPESSPSGSATPGASPAGTGAVAISVGPAEAEAFEKQLQEKYPISAPENQGGQFIYGYSTDIQTTNTVLVDDSYSSLIAGLVFDSLIGFSPVDGANVPTGLVESWEILDDNVTYILHLREGVKWHDGEPFTSEDVVFTFDSCLAEDSQSVRKGTVEPVVESYEAVDDLTVKFVSKGPIAIFLTEGLGQFGIMPKHIWQDVAPADWPTDPGSTGQDPSRVIGTGPFKFKEWRLGETVTLEKNADYWDKKNVPVIDEFIYQVFPDDATALSALQTGQIDQGSVPFQSANSVRQSNPELQVIDYDTTAFNYFHCNQDASKLDLFTDRAVRQALLYAIDRETMAQVVYDGFAIQANGTQPVLSLAYRPDEINTIYNYDPDKARQVLADAGWTDSDGDGVVEKDGVKLSFEMIFSEGVGTYEVQIPQCQQQWKEVGIECFPHAIPFPTLSTNTEQGDYAMCTQGFSWSIDGGQDAMFASDMTPPNGFNVMRYSNADYDALVAPSKAEVDVEKRIDILTKMSNIVNDDAAVGVNVFRKDIDGGSPRIQNFYPNGYSGLWWITRCWLSE